VQKKGNEHVFYSECWGSFSGRGVCRVVANDFDVVVIVQRLRSVFHSLKCSSNCCRQLNRRKRNERVEKLNCVCPPAGSSSVEVVGESVG
jgi:hypothetical protein